MIQGLRTVVYFVKDIEQAKLWYSDVLEKQPYFDTPYYVGYNIGGFELGLHPASEDTISGTSAIAYWGVADANQAFETLIAKGAQAQDRIDDVGEGILIGSVKDPFGNIFGIIQNPGFKLIIKN